MTSPKSKDPLHNPFYNRFNDPVRRRQEDLQSHAYSVWLKEQNRILPPRDLGPREANETENVTSTGLFASGLAGALVLFVVLLISVGVLLKSL